MMKRRTFVVSMLAVIGAVLVAAFAIARAPTVDANNRHDKLVGSWNVETTVEIQNATFPALLTFTEDGNVIADEPPSPFETSGHGNWIGTDHNEVAYTFVALIGSAGGPLSAKLKVVGTLQLDADKGTWNGPFKIDVFDPSG